MTHIVRGAYWPFNHHWNRRATDHRIAIQWLVHWPLMSRLLHLVQRRGEWAGPQPAAKPLLAVPNVTAHPSTASVPTSYYSMWHYNCLWSLKARLYSDTTQLNSTQLNWPSWTVMFLFMMSRPTNWVNWVTTFIDRWQLFMLERVDNSTSSWVELCRYKHPLMGY